MSNNLLLVDPTVNSFSPNTSFSSSTYNTDNTLKFKDYKSSNAQFLGSERTVRLLNNVNSNNYKWNTTASPNLTTSLDTNLSSYGQGQDYVYSSSLSNWSDFDKYIRFANNVVW